MMKSLLRLDEDAVRSVSPGHDVYESSLTIRSKSMPGVAFTIHRISFGRRMELCRRIREIANKIEFLDAGETFREKVEANLLSHEIDRVYLDWGLSRVEGLSIDGENATCELLIDKGPEALTKEIVSAIKAECSLSEEERKN